MQELWHLVKRSSELGLPPSIDLFKKLAFACGRHSNFYLLRGVLPAYLEAGLPLSRAIISSVISACGRDRKFDYAWVSTSSPPNS